MSAIRPSTAAIVTVENKMKALGHDVPFHLIRSCLSNAYEVDKEMIANKVREDK